MKYPSCGGGGGGGGGGRECGGSWTLPIVLLQYRVTCQLKGDS